MRGISVTTLVLLFLAGTQARHFWQQDEPPQSPVQHLKEQFHAYLESAKASAKEVIAQLDASNFGQRFDLDLGTKVEMVAAVAEQLREQLAPSYQAMRERIHSDYEELTADLAPIKAKVMPLFDDLNANLQEVGQAYYAKVTPLVEEWRESARQDMDSLRSKMEPISAQLRDKVRVLVADFRQKAAPFMEEARQAMRQKAQQLQERAVPRVQEIRTIVQEQIASLHEAAAPIVETLRHKMGPLLKNVEERLVSLLETLQRNLDQESTQQQQQS
ncbi:PREDICTED: apolipoprotein A-I [Gekko japonicus]|uniref:Apolipoprotein A-I n=1 Tax=Gekko japonicus TaxID=146911 RepID=A0ABM1LC50_GEKJA|nr:PREDICTED: apolipoprotein A-I [Gekko japonicus]